MNSQTKYEKEIPVTSGNKPHLISESKPVVSESEPYIIRVGGLDLAKRIDHSALIILRLEKTPSGPNYFWIEAQMEWPHINYKKVAQDVLRIYSMYPMDKIGFDRSGVGDAASELFDKTSLAMEEIVTTMQRKFDIINIMKGLFEHKKLVLDPQTGRKIMEQMLSQERIISDAGNELYKHPSGTHDDLFWALGYACYVGLSYVLEYQKPVITSGPPRETDVDVMINRWMDGADSILSI